MKKITVLTPTYNDSKSITETLTSLSSQTYTNWESIIIDDGSTDNTKSIIENFKKEKADRSAGANGFQRPVNEGKPVFLRGK